MPDLPIPVPDLYTAHRNGRRYGVHLPKYLTRPSTSSWGG